MLVAEHDPGHRLDLDVEHRVALVLREAAHLLLGEADVGELAGGDAAHRPLDVLLGHPEGLGLPAVELRRELAHGGVAACLDVAEDALDDAAHLGVVVATLGLGLARLEDLGHGIVRRVAALVEE